MKKNPYMKTIVYYVSLVIIVIVSFETNYKEGVDIKNSIFILLITLIPAIYSLIPLMKELKLDWNKSRNRLTSGLFTDREKDLENLISLLSTQEHRIEIKGREESCGKTWLAMRLCDYINNPKDKSFNINNPKLPYVRADYLDLNEYTNKELNEYFNTHIITPKDVLIFDHVNDIDNLINKQECYHFQMIYVMSKPSEIDYSSHYISVFNITDIGELHQKIRGRYPGLSEVTEKEFNTLYELTNGNIGRISGILSEEKCIGWLKEIANGSETEYDKELNKIQIELFTGKYKSGKKKLESFSIKYSDKMKNVMDLKYKYELMHSDCEHLLNNYNDALSILSVIEVSDYIKYNKNYEIELHKAHYLKHLWKCDDALDILRNLFYKSYSAITDSLGILAAKYFINDLHVDYDDKNSIEVYKDYYICAKNSQLPHSLSDTYKLMRHKAIYEYYTQKTPDFPKLIEYSEDIIQKYKAENNRLLANAYFIKGELYRLSENYNNAIVFYKKCLSITDDNNIIIQTNLMVYYLKIIKKIELDFKLISDEKINKLCEHNNYAHKVYNRIKCIELNDPNVQEIYNCFDSRIMPIL